MKNKGFTLVELLAVIVILAVISLIATPMILGVIETAKKSASVESANGLLDAADKYMITSMFDESTVTRFDFPGDTKLSYKGTKPTSGTLVVDKDGDMSVTVSINGYCVRKRFSEKTPTIIETEDCSIEDSEIAYAENYREDILNGADPVIAGNLIPVTIDSDGKVYQADVKREWYNYANKTWANAIVLKDGATVELDGSILEENIKQYYVWIPRYKYQLWNVNSEALYPNGTEGPSAINIVFESKNTQVSSGTTNGEWLTHPAFQTFNTAGLWVGKFETSYDENTFTNSSVFATTNPNTSAATSSSNIIIKPNVRSLTNKTPSQFYTLSSGVNTDLNSHMMKNSEWGAVAYLTYSNYGKCTSEGCEEVYINNVNTGYFPASSATYSGQWQHSTTITGCSGASASAGAVGSQSACASGYAWNGTNNKASTTGNTSGIYDMSGGNWEYVMGVIKDASGNPMSGRNSKYNSGFNGTFGCPTCDSDTSGVTALTTGTAFPTDTRYYDLYTANSTTLGDGTWWVYTNGHLGDANKEIAQTKANGSSGDRGLWYSDYAYFPTAAYPWVARGGDFYDGSGSGAGVFSFIRAYGNADSSSGFRVVLAY